MTIFSIITDAFSPHLFNNLKLKHDRDMIGTTKGVWEWSYTSKQSFEYSVTEYILTDDCNDDRNRYGLVAYPQWWYVIPGVRQPCWPCKSIQTSASVGCDMSTVVSLHRSDLRFGFYKSYPVALTFWTRRIGSITINEHDRYSYSYDSVAKLVSQCDHGNPAVSSC